MAIVGIATECSRLLSQVFSFNVGWIMPICEVNYTESFILNTVIMPLTGMALVALTWAMDTGSSPDEENQALPDADADAKMRSRAKRADYYFVTARPACSLLCLLALASAMVLTPKCLCRHFSWSIQQ